MAIARPSGKGLANSRLVFTTCRGRHNNGYAGYSRTLSSLTICLCLFWPYDCTWFTKPAPAWTDVQEDAGGL